MGQESTAITIFYADMRGGYSRFEKHSVAWHEGLSAADAVRQAMGDETAQVILDDLAQNNFDLMVSWLNPLTDEHSELGGIGSLDWEIESSWILTITYADQQTTGQQDEKFETWLLANS